MSIATASQIRSRFIYVTIPPSDEAPDEAPGRVKCRQPDPLVLVAEGLLQLDIYGGVMALIADRIDAAIDNRPLPGDAPTRRETAAFLDRWVCAAAVEPVVVLTEQDAAARPEALWIEEMGADLKLAIFRATNARLLSQRVIDAVADFRRHQSTSARPGPDGTAVRDAAVGAAAGG